MSPTRRVLLAGLLSVSGLSGCLSAENGSEADEHSTQSTNTAGRDDNPTVLQIRSSDGEPILSETTDESTSAVWGELVGDRGRLDDLNVATGVSDEDKQAMRTFLDETEYATESIFITHSNIRSCNRFQIQFLSWDGTDIEYRYCRELRPPEASCVTDTWETVGLLFRIPATLPSSASLGGSGGRSPCQGSSTTYDRIDANATVAGNTTAIETPDIRSNSTGDVS